MPSHRHQAICFSLAAALAAACSGEFVSSVGLPGDDDGPESPDAAPGSPDAGGPGGQDAGVAPLAQLRGVNLAGAEFGSEIPGTYGTTYTYPTNAEIDYFAAKGMTAIRVPFRWERLQRTLSADFDAAELGRLDAVVDYAASKGVSTIIDPHNYARYGDQLIGSAAVSREAFSNLWSRLAAHYKNQPLVVFGLMNEPYGLPAEDWLAAANPAIAAIRAAGATNLVLVPGVQWTGAHSWLSTSYGTPNGQVMTGVVDPGNHFAFEVHQYLDADSSGTQAPCVSATIGVERVAAFTGWAREHGYKAVLGEFGAASDATCLAAVDGLLGNLDANQDVWMGWTWWAAGPFWGEYMFTVEPTAGGADRPQMGALAAHLK